MSGLFLPHPLPVAAGLDRDEASLKQFNFLLCPGWRLPDIDAFPESRGYS